MRLGHVLGLTGWCGLLVAAPPREASACGGCFLPQASSMTTTVTAHRMAFAFSPTRTVLWDQIQYAGSPLEFSWVLPVRGEAQLEAADDAWFESLEAVTSERVTPPQLNCFFPGSRTDGGCSCLSVGGDSASPTAGSAPPSVSPGVMVTHEGTVGPYQFVELTATSSESLQQWLADNNYVVPADIQPVVNAYLQDGFGFLALKLRPGFDVKQMTPVRVITQGATPTLPLRMVAAGTGPFVAITLYVIAEARYEPSGFAAASIDFSKLRWDWMNSQFGSGQSNYAELRAAALAAGDGRGWLTTYASRQAFNRSYVDPLGQAVSFSPVRTNQSGGLGVGAFSNLTDLYFAQASANANQINICPSLADKLVASSPVVDTCRPAPPPATDAGAFADGAVPAPDAGRICDPAPAGSLAAYPFECSGFSDVAAAMIGMHPADVWVTRLEANLPHVALASDLTVRPADKQDEVSSSKRAVLHLNPPCELLENHPESALTPRSSPQKSPVQQAGVGFLSAFALLAARRLARRRRTT